MLIAKLSLLVDVSFLILPTKVILVSHEVCPKCLSTYFSRSKKVHYIHCNWSKVQTHLAWQSPRLPWVFVGDIRGSSLFTLAMVPWRMRRG